MKASVQTVQTVQTGFFLVQLGCADVLAISGIPPVDPKVILPRVVNSYHDHLVLECSGISLNK